MAGDIDANLEEPEGTPRSETIADKLVADGLMDMSLYFLQQQKTWLKDRCTLRMQWDGREVRSRREYILGTDRILFQDAAIQDTRHHSEHYMVLGCLRGGPTKDLTGCLQKACRFPLRPLRHNLVLAPDKLFSELKTQIPKLSCVSR